MCPNIGKDTKLKCWNKWQLCVYCATKIHPEEYKTQQIRVNTKTNTVRYTKCEKCNNVMFTLRYVSVRSFIAPFKYCRKCNTVKEVKI